MASFTKKRSTRTHLRDRRALSQFSREVEGGRDETASTGEPVSSNAGRKPMRSQPTADASGHAPQSPATTMMTTAGESASFEAWTRCATAMKDHEDARIEAWKEEIDAELVFAALFSAILTAFDVEAYKMLQPQDSNSPNTPTFIIVQADGTQQLNASALTSVLAAQSAPTPGPSPRYAVAINALWFSALICSLAAASISILVRQWLNQYTSGLASVSPEIARVRQFRRDNLKKWRVAEIMMLLPVLLQGAMVLFLIGLVLFLEQLNTEITYIASILVAILLFFILITTILPTFNDDCSYQSPQAWGFFVIFQGLKRPLRSICRSISAYANGMTRSRAEGYFRRTRDRYAKRFVQKLAPFANKPNTYSWAARERMLVDTSGSVLDQHLIVEADATFLDDAFLRDVVRPCLDDMPPDAALKAYYDIMAHRADRIEFGVPYFDTRNGRAESVAVLTDLTLDALQRMREAPVTAQEDAIRTIRILEPLLVRALPLTYDHFCRVFFALSDDAGAKVRHVAFSVLYNQLWRNLELADVHFAGGCHDLAALVKFIAIARQNEMHGAKRFLDACDLFLCLATLPSLSLADYTGLYANLQSTLGHLRAFFETPLWRNDLSLLHTIARIAPRLVQLEHKYARSLEDDLVNVLADVVEQVRQLNHDGNWEDKLQILEMSFVELRKLRQSVDPACPPSPYAASPSTESLEEMVWQLSYDNA